MPAFVIYARKSTESEDRQILSIDSQIRELRTLASRQGIPVAEVLTESRSAKAPGRPVFSNLMRRVQRGEVQGIIAWKMDRLARNHLDTGTVLQALSDGVLKKVITIDRTYTPDGNDRFIGNFELGMATKYIDDLRQNVKRGIRAKLQQGWVHYTPPLGYLMDPATKTIVKDPERFDLVRRMWDLLLTRGIRPDAILKVATTEWGFRTRKFKRIGGGALTHSGIYRVFQNPFYMGLIVARKTGEQFVGAHPPMVSRAEFVRAQELLGGGSRARPKSHEFSLAGFIRCGTCRSLVTGEEHVKPSGLRFAYYRCPHRRPAIVCHEPAVREDEAEAQVAEMLGRLAIPAPVIQLVKDVAERALSQEVKAREDARRAVQASLDSTAGEIDRLLELHLRNVVDADTFEQKRRKITERKTLLGEKLREFDGHREDLSARVAQVLAFAASARERFLAGTPVQKRLIVNALFLNSRLTSKKVALQLKNPFDRLAENASMSNFRREWDSNPRTLAGYTLSKRAPSTTRPSLQKYWRHGHCAKEMFFRQTKNAYPARSSMGTLGDDGVLFEQCSPFTVGACRRKQFGRQRKLQ